MVGSRAAAHLIIAAGPTERWMDGLGQGLGKPCPEGSARVRRLGAVSGGSDGWGHTNVTQEVCVGGGVAALLFSYFPSHYLWLRPP